MTVRSSSVTFLNAGTSYYAREISQRSTTNFQRCSREVLGIINDADLRSRVFSRTATVTLLAGAGTRWVDSLSGRELPQGYSSDMPRCAYPVEDVTDPGKTIPVGAYNLRAVSGLGKHFIVWGSHKGSIENIVLQAGIEDAVFVEQSKKGFLKPLGHGDAMAQVMPHLGPEIDFVIANFGGDANSRETILTSLLVLAAMQEAEEKLMPWGILPTTMVQGAKYPIGLNGDGFPVSFGHQKLKGAAHSSGEMPTNVGVRLYSRRPLADAIDHFNLPEFFVPGSGYIIPGNTANEFALDNVDAYMSVNENGVSRQRFRILNVAGVEETTAVKGLDNVDAFLAAQKIILGI